MIFTGLKQVLHASILLSQSTSTEVGFDMIIGLNHHPTNLSAPGVEDQHLIIQGVPKKMHSRFVCEKMAVARSMCLRSTSTRKQTPPKIGRS